MIAAPATVVDALQDKYHPCALYHRNRWLYWDRSKWVVREQPPGARESVILLETPDEVAAVRMLLGERRDR